ncbi:MAG: hypothetical protein WDO19_15655 [Bacteroidota bacterium]
MENVFRKFYRNLYLHTGGFIPAKPLNQKMLPGDFFQIQNGEMILLGNIFRNHIIDREYVVFGNNNLINPSGWSFSEGVNKAYSGRAIGQGPVTGNFEYSKQVLLFSERASFIFKGNEPESVRIANWNDWQQALIIKLTTTLFSFRELYVVTESAGLNDWTLAIAGSRDAELEIATESENFGLVEIFGYPSKTIQSKDIDYYHREEKRKPVFFKAKKLTVQDEKLQVFISNLLNQLPGYNEWASAFYDFDFDYDNQYSPHPQQFSHAGVLEMLQANELNPNTALQYFKWTDANMDDIEKLFMVYG